MRTMRTTVDLDPEILSAARQLAAARSISLGKALSELARRGLQPLNMRPASKKTFPTFEVSPNARALTSEEVRRDEDEI
jgi:hypothetical protein